jgi:hypothetical protein
MRCTVNIYAYINHLAINQVNHLAIINNPTKHRKATSGPGRTSTCSGQQRPLFHTFRGERALWGSSLFLVHVGQELAGLGLRVSDDEPSRLRALDWLLSAMGAWPVWHSRIKCHLRAGLATVQNAVRDQPRFEARNCRESSLGSQPTMALSCQLLFYILLFCYTMFLNFTENIPPPANIFLYILLLILLFCYKMFLTFRKTYAHNISFLCKHGYYLSPEWIEFTKKSNDILVTWEREELDFIGFLILSWPTLKKFVSQNSLNLCI